MTEVLDLFTIVAPQPITTAHASRDRRTRGLFVVHEPEGARTITSGGRNGWALRELILAGRDGCTAIDPPAPRWSSYVHRLRTIYGLDIETINEEHGGEFAGRHARYLLRSPVTFADPADAARAEGVRHV